MPDTGCPSARIAGTCLIAYSNVQQTGFSLASLTCANLGADLCTDSQAWPISIGFQQNLFSSPTVLQGPHWTASFADNDSVYWSGANGGTGDNNSANSSYGYACCGGTTPANPRVSVQTIANVKVTAIHNVADTYFSGAVAYCAALNSDICTDSQTYLLRQASQLTVATWTNSHADNDAQMYNAINGGTSDDPLASQPYGFACCPSLLPQDLSCPVARTSGVCAVSIHNTADASFGSAAMACAASGGDICSMSQTSVLRAVNALTVPAWTNSHSDNDASNANSAIGAMPDNPSLDGLYGYACCLK